MIINTKEFVDFNTTFYDDSKITTQNSAEAIDNSISNIIFTTKGEKVGDPEFGTNVKRLLFRPIDSITEHLIKSDIMDNIERYEPRVEVDHISIVGDEDFNYYKVQVLYTIIRTPDVQNKYVTVLKRL